MSIINAERMLQFRSSKALFARINDFLESFAASNLIDVEDLYEHIMYLYSILGVGIWKECEAIIEVKHGRAKLPCNFKLWYAAYRCRHHGERGSGEGAPDINEQLPWIWYQQAELSTVCANDFHTEKTGPNGETVQNKIVIRTFVNGDPYFHRYDNHEPLFLSPNVKDRCAPDAVKVNHTHINEVTVTDDGYIQTVFKEGHIYMQYYGIPFDEDYMPMIPDEEIIEKAIEFYIYTKLFEKWYLNSTVPNIAEKLSYVKKEYTLTHFPMAKYWVNLPSFQRMCQSIRTMKGNLQFYQPIHDRTRMRSHGYGHRGWGGGYGYYR